MAHEREIIDSGLPLNATVALSVVLGITSNRAGSAFMEGTMEHKALPEAGGVYNVGFTNLERVPCHIHAI